MAPIFKMALRLCLLLIVVAAATLGSPKKSEAIFHIAVIAEVMSGFNGDPNVQYMEIRMDFPGQNFVDDTLLSVFDEDSDPALTELLLLDHDVPNDGVNVRWLMATQAFADQTGLTPDFIFPPGFLTPKGMICWGAPDFAPPPDEWNHSFPFLYTDCVSYGGYAGPPFPTHPPATALPPGDGAKALQRLAPASPESFGSVLEDLNARCPLPEGGAAGITPRHLDAPPDELGFNLCCPTPENNAGQMVLLGDDDDGDGLPNCHEAELGTVTGQADTDQDGCLDGAEAGRDVGAGGLRAPDNFWDFYDVPSGDPPLRDQQIFGQDIGAIVARFGTNDEGPGPFDRLSDPLSTPNPVTGDNRQDYHPAYDRTPLGPNAWNLGPPDGSVFGQDVGLVVIQFGDDCSS